MKLMYNKIIGYKLYIILYQIFIPYYLPTFTCKDIATLTKIAKIEDVC